jgi:hypothetical protein
MWMIILRRENEAGVKVCILLYDELSKQLAVQIHNVICMFVKLFMFMVKSETVTDKMNSIICIFRKYHECTASTVTRYAPQIKDFIEALCLIQLSNITYPPKN